MEGNWMTKIYTLTLAPSLDNNPGRKFTRKANCAVALRVEQAAAELTLREPSLFLAAAPRPIFSIGGATGEHLTAADG